MPSPQMHELGRLANFNSLNNVAAFAQRREQHGLNREMAVVVKCSDGFIEFMPG